MKKEDKKKLCVKRLTIQNLDLDLNIKQTDVLVKKELRSAKGGKEDTTVGLGVTDHPKYC